MAQGIHLLTNIKAKNARPGKHRDGGGLWLKVRASGSRQWLFIFTLAGKPKEMGLGGYPKVSLERARDLAREARAAVAAGHDPVEARNAQKAQAKAQADTREARTLAAIAKSTLTARQSELRDGGKAGRWLSPLRVHVLPSLGKRDISTLTGADIAKELRPIWQTKPDTARKALQRLGMCLAHARASGVPVDRGAIEDARELLGRQVHAPQHIASMDWRAVPGLYQKLENSPTDRALKLLILTGLRSMPVRFAHVSHFDGDVWTVPADLMKGQEGRASEFRVPLSAEAKRIVEDARQEALGGFLFPGDRHRKAGTAPEMGSPIRATKGLLSDMALPMRLRRLKLAVRPHGFRSSLRMWAEENTNASFEVKEALLSHKVGNAVSRAYQRGDLLDRRATVLQAWADHVTGAQSDKVHVLTA